MPAVDLAEVSVRELNQQLHDLALGANETEWTISNPRGRHAIAVAWSAMDNAWPIPRTVPIKPIEGIAHIK